MNQLKLGKLFIQSMMDECNQVVEYCNGLKIRLGRGKSKSTSGFYLIVNPEDLDKLPKDDGDPYLPKSDLEGYAPYPIELSDLDD
jgi:hypothetical protein